MDATANRADQAHGPRVGIGWSLVACGRRRCQARDGLLVVSLDQQRHVPGRRARLQPGDPMLQGGNTVQTAFVAPFSRPHIWA